MKEEGGDGMQLKVQDSGAPCGATCVTVTVVGSI